MRDFVDPWAHNNNNGGSPMMGGNNGGSLASFGSMGSMGNNGNNNSMTSLSLGNNTGPNNGNNGGGGGFGSNMDMDKTSTQVTIPKDVSRLLFFPISGRLIIKFFNSLLVLSLAKAVVASVVFVRSPTRLFRSTKPFPAQLIASSPSPERQNRSKRLNTCSSKGKANGFYHFIFSISLPHHLLPTVFRPFSISNTISFHHGHHYMMIIMCSSLLPFLSFFLFRFSFLLCNSIAFVDSVFSSRPYHY